MIIDQPTGGNTAVGDSITGGTLGSVLFVNPTNVIAQTNNNFYIQNSATTPTVLALNTNVALSTNTVGDFSGTDAVNIYGQYDAYLPNSAITNSLVGLNTDGAAPIYGTSSSRGTGASPLQLSTGDMTGGFFGFGAQGAGTPAYQNLGGMAVFTTGSSSNNLGGELRFYTKGDGGTLTQQLSIGNSGVITAVGKTIFATSTTGASSLNIPIGTAPTTPTIGDVWNDTNQNMVAFFNGNTLYQAGNLYTATASVTIVATSPVTAFSSTKIGTTTIKANTLKVGQKFAIWGAGNYSTPIGNTDTVTITVKIGSVTISTVTTGAFPATATNFPFDFLLQFTIRSIGASATLVCDGAFNYSTALSAVAKTSNSLSSIGTITFDSTVDEAMDVQVNWNGAVTTQSAVVQQSKIDFL